MHGWKPPEYFMLIRKVVTGTTESPPLYTTMAILGQATCVQRLQDASAKLKDCAPETRHQEEV